MAAGAPPPVPGGFARYGAPPNVPNPQNLRQIEGF